MYQEEVKNTAQKLRGEGKTYTEIKKALGQDIPKSTLSYWCRGIKLPPNHKERIRKKNIHTLKAARKKALKAKKVKRKKYLNRIKERNQGLAKAVWRDKDIAKIALGMLYLGEGAKDPSRGSVLFGNADPRVIKTFLALLRFCYDIDESKFRCTVQCRADQNTRKLEEFWRDVTGIPQGQFYRTRIDPRTVGKKTKQKDYKGVCRVDYFSAELLHEFRAIIELVNEGPVV